MSIASRIEAIEQHLTDDYSVLELAGADLTNVDKNIENLKQSWEERLLYFLANGTDVVWNNWLPKVTGSGTTLSINNTIQAPMKIVYGGNTSQTGTPTPDTPIPVQVVSGDNTIKVEGKNLLDICYTYDIGYSTTINGIKYTINEDKSIGVKGTTGSSVSIFNINNNDGNAFADFINKQVILTGTPANASSSSSWCGFYTSSYSGEKADTGSGKNITLDNTYTRFIIRVGVNETIDTTYYPMVRLASITDNTYVPYQTPQTYPINIGNIELCKIGNYQDKIYKDNGKWYLNKKIGKIVYNGSESGSWTPSVSGGLTRFAGPKISDTLQTARRYEIKSNYFHYLSSGSEVGAGFIYSGQFFAYPNQTITTEQNFRYWLSTHNTTIYYPIATPTTTEITDTTLISQLEAIKKSYNNQTNISQENSKEAFILDVTALGN